MGEVWTPRLDQFCSQAGGPLPGRVTEMESELPITTTTELGSPSSTASAII